MDVNKAYGKKSLTATTQECWEQYWTSPGGSTPQRSSYTATYHPSRKLSKLDEPGMRETAGEVGTNISDIFLLTLYIDDQLEPIYNSSVPIQDVTLKNYRERWTIETGGGRGSGRSVLAAWHDDDGMKKNKTKQKTSLIMQLKEIN